MKDKGCHLVTVVIPTYKRPDMLDRAINSVLNQTYKNIEIIVVDDNNTDSNYRKETMKYMEKYNNIPNINYIKHKKNKGGAIARNTGIYKSKGYYVTFLDDDDEYLPTKIEKQIKQFSESKIKNLAFVYCQMAIYDKEEKLYRKTHNYFNGNKKPFEMNMLGTIAGTPSIMVLKAVLLEIGGFKKLKSGQDWNLILEILEKGYQTDYLEEYLVKVYSHDEERISTNSSKLEGHKEIFNIKKKHFSKITKEQKNYILNDYFIKLALHYKNSDKKEAIKFLFKGIKYKKISKKNFICFLSIIEPSLIRKARYKIRHKKK